MQCTGSMYEYMSFVSILFKFNHVIAENFILILPRLWKFVFTRSIERNWNTSLQLSASAPCF